MFDVAVHGPHQEHPCSVLLAHIAFSLYAMTVEGRMFCSAH